MYGADFAQGDIVSTNLKCARGETISLRLDTVLPRPYSRKFEVHGTKGCFLARKYLGPARDNMKKLYIHKIVNVLGSNGKAE